MVKNGSANSKFISAAAKPLYADMGLVDLDTIPKVVMRQKDGGIHGVASSEITLELHVIKTDKIKGVIRPYVDVVEAGFLSLLV